MKKERLQEVLRYGLAGAATTAVNVGLYHLLLLAGTAYRPANLTAIVISKLFAYAVNKLFVFRSHCATRAELWREIGRFTLTRGSTGVLDYFGLIFLVSIMGWDRVWSKYLLQGVIITLNYLLGRRVVFRGRKNT